MHEFQCLCPTAIFRVLDVGQLTVHVACLCFSYQEEYQASRELGISTCAAHGAWPRGTIRRGQPACPRPQPFPGEGCTPLAGPAAGTTSQRPGHLRCRPGRGGRPSHQLSASRQQGHPPDGGGALPGLGQPCFEQAVGLELSRNRCQP